jgi:hypothetical protein
MIGGIAHDVRQGILDQLDHLPIELGVGATHLNLDRAVTWTLMELLAILVSERSSSAAMQARDPEPVAPGCKDEGAEPAKCGGEIWHSAAPSTADPVQISADAIA